MADKINPLSILSFLPGVAGSLANIIASPQKSQLKAMQAGAGPATQAMLGLQSNMARDLASAQSMGHGATRGLGSAALMQAQNDQAASLAPALGMTAARENAIATEMLRANDTRRLQNALALGAGLTGAIAAGAANRVASKDQGPRKTKTQEAEDSRQSLLNQLQSGVDRGTGLGANPPAFELIDPNEQPRVDRILSPLEAAGMSGGAVPPAPESMLERPLGIPSTPPTALESVLMNNTLSAPMLNTATGGPIAPTQLQQPLSNPQLPPVAPAATEPAPRRAGSSSARPAPAAGVSSEVTPQDEAAKQSLETGMSVNQAPTGIELAQAQFSDAITQINEATQRKALALSRDPIQPDMPQGGQSGRVQGQGGMSTDPTQMQTPAPPPMASPFPKLKAATELKLLLQNGAISPYDAFIRLVQDYGFSNAEAYDITGWRP